MDKSVLKNKPFLFILSTAFLSMMGIGLIIPVIPFIVAKYVGEQNTNAIALNVGLLTSCYSFCQFFAAPIMGALSDKYGRRPILLWCLVGSAIGYVLFGIGGSLWILFLSRVIDGLTGGNIGTAMAFIADITKPQERGKYYGMMGATIGLGFMLGPSLGGLVSHISLSAPLFMAAILTVITIIYGYFVMPESLAKENRMNDFTLHHLNPFRQISYILKNNTLKMLIIIGMFYFLAFAQMSGIASVFFKDEMHWNPTNIGVYFLILGIFDMFTQGFLVGKITPRFGSLRLVIAGFFVTAFAFAINAILPFFHFFWLPIVYVIIYSLGSGLFEPSFNGLISRTATPQEQGRIQGASQSMQSIARILGPLIAAFLYEYSHSFPWILCVVLSLIGSMLVFSYQKKIVSRIHSVISR